MDLNIFSAPHKKFLTSESYDKVREQGSPSPIPSDLEDQWLNLDLTVSNPVNPSSINQFKFESSSFSEFPSLSKRKDMLNVQKHNLSLSTPIPIPTPIPTPTTIPIPTLPTPIPTPTPTLPIPTLPIPIPPSGFERLENCELQLKKVVKQLDSLTNKMDELLSTCQRIDTRIVEHNEREVNLQIRKYSIQKHKGTNLTNNSVPLHFVPSTTNGKKHFGLFADLLK